MCLYMAWSPSLQGVTSPYCASAALGELGAQHQASDSIFVHQIPVFVPLTQWKIISVKARGLSPATLAGVRSPLCWKMTIICKRCFHHHCSATLAMILNRSAELHPQDTAGICSAGTRMQVDQSNEAGEGSREQVLWWAAEGAGAV